MKTGLTRWLWKRTYSTVLSVAPQHTCSSVTPVKGVTDPGRGGGGGVSKAKVFKRKYEAKLE